MDRSKNFKTKVAKRRLMKQISPKTKFIITAIILIMITMGIAIAINESYKVGNGYVTLWRPADTLAFYGMYLSFIGTTVLGVVAFYQNKKAQDLNKQLQILQQVQYIPMVSPTKVMIEAQSSNEHNSMNIQMPNINVVDLIANGFNTTSCYHIDVEFKNDSKYPIVQMQVHPGEWSNGNCVIYGIRTLIDLPIYIAKNESVCYRYIVPCEVFEATNKYGLQLCITFINVFDYAIPATLHIYDLQNKNYENKYRYRLSKFIDIRPSD